MNRPQPRILIADDNVEMARTTADGLAEHGYDPVVAAGGQEAIDRLATEQLDAVVTDLRMPGVDGLAVLAASRARAGSPLRTGRAGCKARGGGARGS